MCLPGPVHSITSAGESNASQSSAETLMSGQQEKQMPTHDKSKESEPVSVKANNDVVNFVMDHPAFAAELADQLQHLALTSLQLYKNLLRYLFPDGQKNAKVQ